MYIVYARRQTLQKIMYSRWSGWAIWVSSAYRWGQKPCCSTSAIRSAVYMMNKIGPRAKPCGTPHKSCTKGDLYMPPRTHCHRPWRYEWNQARTGPSNPKVTCNRRHKILWSTVSKAADKSKRTRAATSPLSTASSSSRSNMTRRTAVSVEWPGRKPDWRDGEIKWLQVSLELPQFVHESC